MTFKPIRKVVIFRWLTLTTIPIAYLLKLMGRRVIFIEPKGIIRNISWMDRLKKWGLEWVDYSTFPNYNVTAHVTLPAVYADSLIKNRFKDDDFKSLSTIAPALNGNTKKAKSVLFDSIYTAIYPYSLAYAAAENFKERGYHASIYQLRTIQYVLLKISIATDIRNLCLLWDLGYFYRILGSIWRNVK